MNSTLKSVAYSALNRPLDAIFVWGLIVRCIVFVFLSPCNNDDHLGVIFYIVNTGRLPTSDLMWESFQPPYYYLIAAPFLMFGSVKSVQMFSLLLSCLNLFLIYSYVKRTGLAASPVDRCHMLALVALLPQFVLFGNFISNDALAFLLGTVLLLASFEAVRNPDMRSILLLAVCLGGGLGRSRQWPRLSRLRRFASSWLFGA